MSGIIAHTGPEPVAPILMEGLRQLVRRGHDSVGLAVLERRRLRVWKALGPLAALERRLPDALAARTGIAHTRLATHGAPSEPNAHPHLGGDARVAVVHNGIVENADALRRALAASGVRCASDTDTEVIAQHLALRLARDGESLVAALRAVLGELHGTCGLAVLDREQPEQVVVARIGSPMLVGSADGASFAASDAAALRGRVRDVVPLEDGEIAVLTPSGFEITSLETRDAGRPSIRLGAPSNGDGHAIGEGAGRGGSGSSPRDDPAEGRAPDADDEPGPRDASETSGDFAAILHREILEHPAAIRRTLAGRLDRRFSSVRLGGLNLDPAELRDVRRVHLLGSGSAWHAALSGARMIESLARLPASAESAGEFRHRNPLIERDTLYVVASRSGETFDTLAALREIRRRGGTALGVVNDVGSTIAREVDGGVYLHAGAERSVVATKTVGAMLAVFALLALMLGRLRDVSPQRGARLLDAFDALPAQLEAVLADEDGIARVARSLEGATSVLFVGRAAGHAIALEGARKLAEASSLPASACPVDELAHGPIAQLDERTPCVVLMPEPDLLPLSLSALERIKARGAPLVVVGDADAPRVAELADQVVALPRTEPLLQPILAGIVLQLLAHHAGLAYGHDVERHASLADRITVD